MRRRLVVIAVIVATLLAMALAAWFVLGIEKNSNGKKAPRITLMAPPPPPPPTPPPKFEKKPDPPKEQKEMKAEQPAPKPEPAPPMPELSGPAGNSPSPFSRGNNDSDDPGKNSGGKPGGTGNGTTERSGMFNPFTNFANLAKGELQRHLGRNAALKRRRYVVELRLWLNPAGAVSRYELVGATGDTETDDAIREAMNSAPAFSQAQPAGMPQPLRLRVTTGG